MNKLCQTAMAVAALLCVSFAARAETHYSVKIGLATYHDAQNVWADQFAKLLEKDSGGRIDAHVYPSSQLGTIPRMIEETQFGAIQVYIGPPDFFYGVNKAYGVLSAPSVFTSMAMAHKVVDDPVFRKKFLALGESKGLVGIGLFLTGPGGFVLRTPVHSLKQLAGMKIRTFASPMQSEQVRALKAIPVPMSLGEVMPALQQGALGGVMGGAPVFTPMKYMSAAKYLLESEQFMIPSMVVASRKWLQSLPPDLRKIVIEDGMKEDVAIYPVSVKKQDESLTQWKAGGGEVLPYSAAEKADMEKLMAPIGPRVAASEGPEVQAMYAAMMAAVKRAE